MEIIDRCHDKIVESLSALRDEVRGQVGKPEAGVLIVLYDASSVPFEQVKRVVERPEAAGQVEMYPNRQVGEEGNDGLPETMIVTGGDEMGISRRVVVELVASNHMPDWSMLEVEVGSEFGVREDEVPTVVQYRKHAEAGGDIGVIGWNKLELNGVDVSRVDEVVRIMEEIVVGIERMCQRVLDGKYHARIRPVEADLEETRFLEAAAE